MVPGTWITNHLNKEQIKVSYLEASAFQMFAIQMPTVRTFLGPFSSYRTSSDIAGLSLMANANSYEATPNVPAR